MANHTPAPWDVDTDGAIIGRRFKYKEIAAGTAGGGIKIHNDADRDLILAAPDMYEALKTCFFENEAAFLCLDGSARRRVINALEKARGEV